MISVDSIISVKERLETMKIHTTQNLNLFNTPSTNENKFRKEFTNSQIRYEYSGLRSNPEEMSMSSVSFKAKKPKNVENAKKALDIVKKGLEDIKDKAMPEVEKGDKTLMSSFFNACLQLVTASEIVFTAATAAIICIFLRPLTIMALPSKDATPKAKVEQVEKPVEKDSSEKNVAFKGLSEKVENDSDNADTEQLNKTLTFRGGKKTDSKDRSVTKTNNMYASSQSIASGIAGLVSTISLTYPFKLGQDYVLKNLHKFLKPESIKELYPWVEEASIKAKDKLLKPMGEWKNIDGLKFISDIKNCDMLPDFKRLSDVSKETFEKILKLDIDYAAQKGKSFNEVVTKNGKTLYESIAFDKLGIKVKEEGFKDSQILLKDLDKEYLEKIIADSKGVNEWGNLDINSVFDSKGIKDFRSWKNVEGKQWKLDLDSIFVSSELETANYKPRISGKKRFDKKDQEWKFVAYQQNGVDGKLGSEITNQMVEAEANNAVLMKCLTWLPDLSFRVPVAVGTIALIPWVLKNVFHLEKVKPNTEKQENAVKSNEEVAKQENVTFKGKDSKVQNNNITFKGKAPSAKEASWLTKLLAKWYGKPLIASERMRKVSEKLSKVPGDATEHMVVLGSLIQSGVYVNRTLSNKDLDDDRKKTLAINQALCFVIPTIAGYTVNSALGDVVKKIGYRYTGLKKREIASLKAQGNEEAAKKAAEVAEKLGKNIKGVGMLARLLSFTLIYRYLTPVLVTPVANKLGDKYFSKKPVEKQ